MIPLSLNNILRLLSLTRQAGTLSDAVLGRLDLEYRCFDYSLSRIARYHGMKTRSQ